jgi:predicted RNase H-like nuclease (RuvC/YqgF family)
MTQSEKDIAAFQTRVRQMILRFQELKQENKDLYAMIDENEQQIEQLKAKVAQQEREYQTLKMARMMEISDGDLEESKERLASLIRSITKCIAMLSDEK